MRINILFADERMNLDSALISGRQMDGSPTSCYIGSIDLDEIHSALYYSHRAIIHLLTDKFDVPFEEVDNFLLSALAEALTKEYNNKLKGESDMDVRASMKFGKKNQN
jgi:hypothetical protein